MNNIYEGYDCVSTKPDIDEIFIAHYGVKGMKWHKRLKGALYKLKNKIKPKKMSEEQISKYVHSHIIDDIKSGKASVIEPASPRARESRLGHKYNWDLRDSLEKSVRNERNNYNKKKKR